MKKLMESSTMTRQFTLHPKIRLTTIAIASACALVPAQAGFLDDFYTASGATVNMTPAGVYEGQSSNVMTGGGFTYRVPNRTFNPVTFSPPNFSAGCGGIDLYLGAMGFPSSAEMTAFLRNIGQAAGGIAFDIALKALSPELSTTINNFSKDIQAWTKDFRNSCKAATALMETTGASAAIAEIAGNAKKSMRLSSSDESANEKSAADMAKIKAEANAFASANPGAGLNPQRNLVWEALHSGDFGSSVTDQEKRFIMAITGSIVIRFTSESDSSSPITKPLAPATGDVDELIEKLIGDKTASTVEVPVYNCTNVNTGAPPNFSTSGFNNCLEASLGNETIGGGFRYRLEEAKNAVVTAIRTRQALTADARTAYGVLHASSSLPILKVVQASAQQRNNFIGDATVEQYLDIAAREMAINYLRTAVSIVKMTASGAAGGNSKAVAEEMDRLQAKASDISTSLANSEKSMRDKINNLSATLATYESVRKYMQNTMSADMTRSRALGG